ncbi:MAG: hypothetical protein JKY54_02225 [Flavobacteriales bacterium]|nr:hypothetical protein [Flavobacteriales bacterium]
MLKRFFAAIERERVRQEALITLNELQAIHSQIKTLIRLNGHRLSVEDHALAAFKVNQVVDIHTALATEVRKIS